MNKNKLFQFIYYNFVRGFFPRKVGDGHRIADYSRRLFAQLWLSEKFGGPELVLIGDSNSEAFSSAKDMRRLDCLAIALGIGGTRPDQWAEWFQSPEGKSMQARFGNATVLWNIGGNAVLQDRMDAGLKGLESLRAAFPESYNCLIPAIYVSQFPEARRETIARDVTTINDKIKSLWGDRVIDLHTPTKDPQTGEALPGLLEDPVHYSTLAQNLIIEFLNKSGICKSRT